MEVITLLAVIAWNTSAIAGALIGANVGQVRLCAALGFGLGPLGVLCALFIGPREPKPNYDALGPDLPKGVIPAAKDNRPRLGE